MKILATISCGILQERCGKVTVSRRKAPEIPRKWKQYSGRKFFGFFPVNSCQLPVLADRKRSEIIRKKSEKVPVGILLPSSGVFPMCSSGMRRKYNGSSQFLPYVFALGRCILKKKSFKLSILLRRKHPQVSNPFRIGYRLKQ